MNSKITISQISVKSSVLTTSKIAPHLAYRELIGFTKTNAPTINLKIFDYLLLNRRYPEWLSNPEFVSKLVEKLKNIPEFTLKYQQDDVYLFNKK